MIEEFLVSTLQDVEFRVVQFGILVHGPVSLTDKAAHPRTAFWRELTVEDDDDTFVRAVRDDGRCEEEVLHLVLLVQVQSSLNRPNTKFSTQHTKRFQLNELHVYGTDENLKPQ